MPTDANTTSLEIMGVHYTHEVLPGGDDLYLTPFGRNLRPHLTPDNYYSDPAWQGQHRRALNGTSCVYYAETKPVDGRTRELVLKWNRMGQDIPGGTGEIDFDNAEFNTPFEEFALVYELRRTRYESPGGLYTQKPLAIYVPHEDIELERLGRKAYRIEDKQRRHAEVRLHPRRRYAVIYQWIRGLDAYEAWQEGLLSKEELHDLGRTVSATMAHKGFAVADHKATHIIVRPARGGHTLRRGRDGRFLYAYVDFELLRRTPEREAFVRARNRRDYLQRQARRFAVDRPPPPHLHRVKLLDLDYIYRPIQSTGGALWVVGRDPDLFEYFLPEKWRRTPRTKLSNRGQTYHTCTKDNVHLVWRVSRVGEQPDMDPFRPGEQRILAAGYNSPFEEFALSHYLADRGVATTYPRAIYMTGSESQIHPELLDDRRYRSHAALRTPEGHPVLQAQRDYILIWGFWNGPDESLAWRDEDHWQAVSALQALREGILDEAAYFLLMRRVQDRLLEVGVEDLNLRGSHILLSLQAGRELVRTPEGEPDYRICSFELLAGPELEDTPVPVKDK